MTTPDDVVRAEARVAEARARLSATMGTLQRQLTPQKLAQDVRDGLSEGAQATARATVDAARRNPAAVAGGIALVALVAGRRKIASGIRGLFRRRPKP